MSWKIDYHLWYRNNAWDGTNKFSGWMLATNRNYTGSCVGLQRFTAIRVHRGFGLHDAPNRQRITKFGDRSSSAVRHFALVALLCSKFNPWTQQQWRNMWSASSSGFLIAIKLKQKDINWASRMASDWIAIEMSLLQKCEMLIAITIFV